MKQYSLKELLANADAHFENLNVEKLYATSDGQYFTMENRALLHATPNRLRVFSLIRGTHDSQEPVTEEEVSEPQINETSVVEADSEIVEKPKQAKKKSK